MDFADVNFFNFHSDIPAVNSFRTAIAQWYYIMRLISAAILLVILIYVGIRMALSTIGQEQAKYKQMLVDWVTSIALLFLLHYIIIFIIGINDALIEVLGSLLTKTCYHNGKTIGEVFNTQLIGVIFAEGINGIFAACLYIAIKGQAFMFFLFYLKRMITVGFLVIIAPLITITYSIDKMGDGKAQALNTWLKELTYNILIQPFHCVIYLAFFGAISNMIHDSFYGSITAYILAFVVLLFMKKAEELLRKIFHFEASSMPSVNETGQNLMNATGKFTQMGMKAGTAFAGFKAAGGFKTIAKDAKQFRENRKVNKELKKSYEEKKQRGTLQAASFEEYKNSDEGKQVAEDTRKKFTAKGTNAKKMSAKAKARRDKKDAKLTNKALESLRSEMSEDDYNAFAERLQNGDENAQKTLNDKKANVKENTAPKKAIKGFKAVGSGIGKFAESDTGKVLGAFVQDNIKLAAGLGTGMFMAGMTGQANDVFSGAQLGYGFAKGMMENSHGTITKATTDLTEKYMEVTGANPKELAKIFNSIKSNGDAGMYKTIDDTLKKFINEVTKILGDSDKARELAYNIQLATMDDGKELDLDGLMDQLNISGEERQSVLDESSKFSKTYIESKMYSNIKLDESAGMDVDTLRANVEKKIIRKEKKTERVKNVNVNVQVNQNPDGTTSTTATADDGSGQSATGSSRTGGPQNTPPNNN